VETPSLVARRFGSLGLLDDAALTFGISRRVDMGALARLALIAVVVSSGCSSASEAEPEPSRKRHVATAEVLLDDVIDVRGRVVDSMTHEPVPGALLMAGRSRPCAKPFPTKDDGTFETFIRCSKSDEHFDIGISAERYCPLHQTWSRGELERSLPLEIDLPRAAGIEGVVRDSNGKPVADLTLMIRPDQGSIESVPAALQALLCPWSLDPSRSVSIPRVTQTDASGRFAVDDFVPWTTAFRIDWFSHYSFGDPPPVFVIAGGPLGGPGERTRVELTVDEEPK